MRIVALINESAVGRLARQRGLGQEGRILRHLGLWYEQRQEQSVRARPGLDPPKILPADWIDGPFPDYEGEQLEVCAND